MRHLKERALLVAVLLGGPAIIGWLGVRPALRELEHLKARRRLAEASCATPLAVVPLGSREKTFLAETGPAARRRLPLVEGDQARLAHYVAVVSSLQSRWRDAGIHTMGIRSSWDPIQASFTLPATPLTVDLGQTGDGTGPASKVAAWVLEARLAPPTSSLMRALHDLPYQMFVLEPVGLRWETDPSGSRTQALVLRNYTLSR